MQISSRVENIFSLAVGLEQKGLGKSIVYCMGDTIFIVNYDRTVLAKFTTDQPFVDSPLVFYANDYDSSKVGENKGMIQFEQVNSDFTRIKSSKAPEGTFEEIQEVFDDLSSFPKAVNSFEVSRSILDFIEPGLSHIELFSEGKSLVVVQRDIYTGNIITIRRNEKGIFKGTNDKIQKDFDPFGVRTVDFQALFVFNDYMTFKEIGKPYLHFKGDKCEGLLATCTYDELGTINYAKGGDHYGRKEPEGGNTEQEVGRQVKKLARRKC